MDQQLEELKSHCKYVIFGSERGASNTPHYQGFLVFPNGKSLSAAKKVLPTAHWEIKRGTFKQAIDYCKKEGQWVEFGIGFNI